MYNDCAIDDARHGGMQGCHGSDNSFTNNAGFISCTIIVPRGEIQGCDDSNNAVSLTTLGSSMAQSL